MLTKNVLTKRIQTEIEELKNEFPQFQVTMDKSNEFIWYISFKGADNTLYANEKFKIKYEISQSYVINRFNNN